MHSEHETDEQRRRRLKKAKEHADRLEQGHLNDQPEPISKRLHSVPLSSEPPMDLIK